MDKALWDKGLAARKSLSTVYDFNRDWQDMLNEFCWGKVLLPHRSQSAGRARHQIA